MLRFTFKNFPVLYEETVFENPIPKSSIFVWNREEILN